MEENDTTKEETFFYHSDHLGSTSYITDDKEISRSMILTCHTANFLLMSTVAPKTYHISSTVNSLIKKQACIIMVQGT